MEEAVAAATPSTAPAVPVRALARLLGVGALLVLLYLAAVSYLLATWWSDPYFGHGLLVPPLAGFLAWRAWPRVQALPKRQELWGGAGVLAALALLAFGKLRGDLFLQAASLVAIVAALVLLTQGRERTRALAGSLAVLVFALPYPWLGVIGPHLQALAANGASRMVAAAGVGVQQDVFTITANGIAFEVAPLCSGLSSLVSLTFVAFVAAHLGAVPALWQGLLTAAAVPLAVASNLVRVSATILVGVTYTPETATGFFHGASNLLLYLLALLPILAAVVLLRRRRRG